MNNQSSAYKLFERGVHLLRESNSLGALACFEKAYDLEHAVRIRSYLGYCIAVQRGQIGEALRLCTSAVREEPENPEHYLNIARVYLAAKRREEAIAALRTGLSLEDNADIKILLDDLGIRKKRVLPFLPRHHFLNKYLGLILHRFRLR
jgi:tetratricopeptide (TPR) repeat protein